MFFNSENTKNILKNFINNESKVFINNDIARYRLDIAKEIIKNIFTFRTFAEISFLIYFSFYI